MITRLTDTDYEDVRIASVAREEGGWGLGLPTCSIWLSDERAPGAHPRVGDTPRLYGGAGWGSQVRGADLNGVPLYYESPDQLRARRRREQAKRDRQDRRRAERSAPQTRARYDALPAEFRRRLDRFRANNPDFWWRHEPYELFTCEEAVKIARHVAPLERQPDLLRAAFEKFNKAPWEEQRAVVSDGHSGNTMGAALRLAWLWRLTPDVVVVEHGALCPLVGCVEYGCVPRLEGVTSP
jgi:hypothetical protein